MGTVSHQQVCAKIEREIEILGSLRRTARELGVSAAYLGNVLAGRKKVGPTLLRALGLRRIITITYEPVRRSHEPKVPA